MYAECMFVYGLYGFMYVRMYAECMFVYDLYGFMYVELCIW